MSDPSYLHNQRMRDLRHEAFAKEADPLYFKWQRGEDGVTEQDWLDAVAAIRERLPYVEPAAEE